MSKKQTVEKPQLSPEQVKEITDYITARKKDGADATIIRKEVFKKFKINTTQWELNWEPKKVKGGVKNIPVDTDKQLTTTHNTSRRIEPVSYKHEFTIEERDVKGNMLAQLEIDRNALEDEKKNISNDFKTKIEEKETQIFKIAQQLNSGYEMRNDDCEVIRNFDDNIKRAFLKGMLVKEERMTAADYQVKLEL